MTARRATSRRVGLAASVALLALSAAGSVALEAAGEPAAVPRAAAAPALATVSEVTGRRLLVQRGHQGPLTRLTKGKPIRRNDLVLVGKGTSARLAFTAAARVGGRVDELFEVAYQNAATPSAAGAVDGLVGVTVSIAQGRGELALVPAGGGDLSFVTGIDQEPDTTITAKRRYVARTSTARVRITFKADRPAATFRCRVDRQAYRPCRSPASFTLAPGRHRFSVITTSVLKISSDPVSKRFSVSRRRP